MNVIFLMTRRHEEPYPEPQQCYGETSKSAGKFDWKAGTTVEVSGMKQGQSSQQQLRSLRLHRFQLRKVCRIAHQQRLRNNDKKGRIEIMLRRIK
ncbi:MULTISPECIES: hypothetical protein [Paraburkholderia]|uniref:hypothetical protein n=1 Tax=Paraburkholderia TaxID=1822464 RepID=UPI002251E294|nr:MULTISPECIES: hypothetical protein [Paraburkholderia]MCX4177165.1 hypothetical protein [Paraburkholderia madseniana]MDQ6465153.1 hypothetical protein [Paraburkholderia madseniana]